MKRSQARKQVKIATIRLSPLKVLIEQSYSTKAYRQVNAVLQPAEPRPPLISVPHSGRKDVFSSAQTRRPDPHTAMKSSLDHQPGWHRPEANKRPPEKKGKPVMKHKGSSESTNELTETLQTAVCPSIAKPPVLGLEQMKLRVIRLNLLRRCRKVRTEAEVEDITRIMYNDRAHIVAVFKDFLIYDDIKELLRAYLPKTEAVRELRKISTKLRAEKFVPCDIALEEQLILKKGKERKEKVRRIKGDRPAEEDGSTFFRTAFLNSLAKEDLSNSLSRLPANSLECSDDEDSQRILELLRELNSHDISLHVKKAHIELGQQKTKKAKAGLNKRICGNAITAKTEPKSKTKTALRSAINGQCANKGRYRPSTATQRSQPTKAISNTLSQQHPAVLSPRTVRLAPGTMSKLDSVLKQQDSSISSSSIDRLSKCTLRNYGIQRRDSHGLDNKESTLLSILGTELSRDRGSVSQSPKTPLFQLRSLETAHAFRPKDRAPASRENNYFTVSQGQKPAAVVHASANLAKGKAEVHSQCSKRIPAEKLQVYYKTAADTRKNKKCGVQNGSAPHVSTAALLLKSSEIARLAKKKIAVAIVGKKSAVKQTVKKCISPTDPDRGRAEGKQKVRYIIK